MALNSSDLIHQRLDELIRNEKGASQAETWRILDYRVKESYVYRGCSCSVDSTRYFEFDLEYTTKRGRVGKATVRLDEIDMEEITEQFVREVVMSW